MPAEENAPGGNARRPGTRGIVPSRCTASAGGPRDRNPFMLWRELGLPSFVVLSLPDLKLESVVPRIG